MNDELRMARMIQRGLSFAYRGELQEDHGVYLGRDPRDGWHACALGIALVAEKGGPHRAGLALDRTAGEMLEKFAELLCIDLHLAVAIDGNHRHGYCAREIAGYLEEMAAEEQLPIAA